MLTGIANWVKGLFAGGNSTQIGKGNVAQTASSAGNNSPVFNAGGNIHFNAPPKEEPDVFADAEKYASDFIRDLSESMKNHPEVRKLVAMERSTYAFNCNDPYFKYGEDTHPGVANKIRHLVRRGLIEHDTGYLYSITEEFAHYLINRP